LLVGRVIGRPSQHFGRCFELFEERGSVILLYANSDEEIDFYQFDSSEILIFEAERVGPEPRDYRKARREAHQRRRRGKK